MSGKVTQKTLVLKTFYHLFSIFVKNTYICSFNVPQNARRMTDKLKYLFVALLGFSAACSTVKNTPVKDRAEAGDAVKADTTRRPHIVVMYGARPPMDPSQSRQRMERMQQDSIAPVLEQPADDMPAKPDSKK